MEIKAIPVTSLQTNCWLVSSASAAVVIDPGEYTSALAEFLNENSDKERMILLTHAHFDHIGGAEKLRESTGVRIAIGKNDAAALSEPSLNLSSAFGFPLKAFEADILLENRRKLTVGDITFETLETPGHTAGGVCYYANGVLFDGDIIFAGSVGRTDFPSGNTAELLSSLKMLAAYLPDSTRICPGHGEETVLSAEKASNPYICGGFYDFM